MQKELTSLVGTIMQFHIDPSNSESFVVGRLLLVFEKSFLVQLITPTGLWDGFGLFELKDLCVTEQETPYLQKLMRLLLLRQSTEHETPQRQANGINTVLLYAKQQNQPIAIELLRSGCRDIIGYVNRFDETYVVIAQIDEWGKSDGVSVICRDSITRIYYADESLTCLGLLHTDESD